MVTGSVDFWHNRRSINFNTAIFHQWEQLVSSGCINNFHIVADKAPGVHEGWYFADSDAYKWLDAASRLLKHDHPDVTLLHTLVDNFIDLVKRAQAPDGYIYTYNQIHFPNSRWENLLIEHELYCHGHLIEACASHFEVTGTSTALSLARNSADLLVREFSSGTPLKTDGHEEIEIALLRLYQVTNHLPYLDLASALLERRGRLHLIAPYVITQNHRAGKRKKKVVKDRLAFQADHPEFLQYLIPGANYNKAPRNSRLRWVASALSGKYFQMHAPIREQTIPVGHAVRFGYLETATAMLARITCDQSLLPAMEQAWERMVTRLMFLTGGLGSIPGLEGFGRDDELDPLYAYAETCAALASIFWNWEMGLIFRQSKFSDLIEWQLYNAAIVGMGLLGNDYLYNNPLSCTGGVTRRPWFAVPCCPSNLSRTLASLDKYIFSFDDQNLWVHQYISGKDFLGDQWEVKMESSLPWEGRVKMEINPKDAGDFTIHIRYPSWTDNVVILVNGQPFNVELNQGFYGMTASGYDPRQSCWLSIPRLWKPGDTIQLDFEMPIRLRRASINDKVHRGKAAVTRGPLVFCLENVDNDNVNIFTCELDQNSLKTEFSPNLLSGTQLITAQTRKGEPLTFIPYHLWANRGESLMTVWVNLGV